MSTIQKVESKDTEIFSLKSRGTTLVKKLQVKNIFPNVQQTVITDPIDSKRISKELTNSLTKSSLIKAGLVFLGTTGLYYLVKNTGISSYFGLRAKTKNTNSKDVGNSEIMEMKTTKNSLSLKTNFETTMQANDPLVNQVIQNYKTEDSTVKFKETKVENFSKEKKEKEELEQRFFNRRLISVQNPIPDQKATLGELFELTIDDSIVFNSNSTLSLEVTNIPDWLVLIPANSNPTFKASYKLSSWALGIDISENYAYVATSCSGLQIVDISDPSNPALESSYYTCDEWAYGVFVFGNYAYVANGKSGLWIIDISNPSNPTFKGSYDTPYALDVAVLGNYAYVADSESGLQIIDISDPSNPTFRGSCDTPGYALKVALFDNYAYVADRDLGFQIIDISDPTNPMFKSLYNTNGYVLEVAPFDNYAYIGDRDLGLQIIDISDPSNPTFKGSYKTASSVLGLAVSGNYAYVGDRDSGLQVIDVSDPLNPIFKGSCDTPGDAREVVLFGNYAYVADGVSGLQIISLNPNKLILSGTPNSVGTYSVDIKACNEGLECTTDSFDIIVRDIDDTTNTTDTTDLTNSIVIISSMTVAACVACVASFSLPLIIGGIVLMIERNRSKILEGKSKKEEKELQKMEIENDKKIVVDNELPRPIEK